MASHFALTVEKEKGALFRAPSSSNQKQLHPSKNIELSTGLAGYAPLRGLLRSQGVPSHGNSTRSSPHQPATRQPMMIKRLRMIKVGFELALPA